MESEKIIAEFVERLKIQKYSLRTIKTYTEYIKLFLFAMEKYDKLSAIPISDVEAFVNLKIKTDNISSSYQRSLIGAIKKLYNLFLNQEIQLNYLLPKRDEYKLPTFFSKKEVKLLLENTDNLKHKAILMTIYSCGLRLSELLNLKIKDVKFSDKLLYINQERGNKNRIVSLPDKLLQVLKEYNQTYKPKDYFFEGEKGNRYTERSVQLVIKKVLIKSKIKTKGTVHSLRHSYAIHLIQSGVDVRVVQELLGHQSIKTTMIYVHVADIDNKKTPSPLDFI